MMPLPRKKLYQPTPTPANDPSRILELLAPNLSTPKRCPQKKGKDQEGRKEGRKNLFICHLPFLMIPFPPPLVNLPEFLCL
jgi:hypothetical protein